MTISSDQPLTVWWGEFDSQEGDIGRWQIGSSTLWLTRYLQEWRIAHYQSANPLDSTIKHNTTVSPNNIHADAKVYRYSFNHAPKTLNLHPVLADRPVVIKPREPFQVQSGEEVTMYVMAPVWIRVSVDVTKKHLRDIPSFRPSDTWFGSSTIEGELCYSSTTLGRLRLQDLPDLPNRAITPIKIRNKSRTGLLLERVKLPVQYLALYRDKNDLWTQAITLVRDQNTDNAVLQIQKGAPTEAGEAERLAEPHLKAERNLVVRAFSRLFTSI